MYSIIDVTDTPYTELAEGLTSIEEAIDYITQDNGVLVHREDEDGSATVAIKHASMLGVYVIDKYCD